MMSARALKRKYRSISLKGTDYGLSLYLSQRRWVGEPPLEDDITEETPTVKGRYGFVWITHCSAKIGAAEINTYEPDPWAANSDFMDTMDAESGIAYDLSHVLCECWPDASLYVAGYGPIITVSNFWVEPGHPIFDIIGGAAEPLFEAIDNHYSIIALKAYPIEYEGKLPDGSLLFPAFEHRRKAMMRFYANSFGVRPLPGEHGAEGWMWRPSPRVADVIRDPEIAIQES